MDDEIEHAKDWTNFAYGYHRHLCEELARAPWWRWVHKRRVRRAKNWAYLEYIAASDKYLDLLRDRGHA